VCVANAGIASQFPGLEYSEDQWRDIMSVNLDGAMYTAQAAGKIFEKQGGSNSMIFTASVSAILVNIPQKQAAYNASKAALVHLAKSLAVEWTDFARVNCISPGFVETDILSIHPEEWRKKWFDMIPGARMAKAAELKSVIILRLYFDE
jgi:sorbose reductase